MSIIGKITAIKLFFILIFLIICPPSSTFGKITLVYGLSEDGPSRYDQWAYNEAIFHETIIQSKGMEWCVNNLSKYRKRAVYWAILGQDGTIGFRWYPATDLNKEYFIAIKEALDIMSERNDTLYLLPPYDSGILVSYQDSVFKVDSIFREEKIKKYFQLDNKYVHKYVHDFPNWENMLLFGEKKIAGDKMYTCDCNLPIGASIYDKKIYEEYKKACAENGLKEIDNRRIIKDGDYEDLKLYWEYVQKSEKKILQQPIDPNHMVSHFYYDAEANIGDATFIPGDTPRCE